MIGKLAGKAILPTFSSKYLRGRGPLLLEFECSLGDRSVASRVESRVKRLNRQHKEDLIAGRFSIADLVPTAEAADAQASGDDCG